MKPRTLLNALGKANRIYLHITNRATWNLFCEQASKECIVWDNGALLKPEDREVKVVVLHSDRTIWKLGGMISHMAYHCSDFVHIDVCKYLTGEKDYVLPTP